MVRTAGPRVLQGVSIRTQNRHDIGSTTARSVGEVPLIRDTISRYSPVIIAAFVDKFVARRNWVIVVRTAGPRVLQGVSIRTQNRHDMGSTTARSLGEVGCSLVP